MWIVALPYLVERCAHHVDDAGEQVEALDVRCRVGGYAQFGVEAVIERDFVGEGGDGKCWVGEAGVAFEG